MCIRDSMYILHVERERMHIRDSEERIIELARICKPKIVAIETENFHDHLIRGMCMRIMSQVMVNIQLIKPTADKIKRARLPAGRVEHGFVYICLLYTSDAADERSSVDLG